MLYSRAIARDLRLDGEAQLQCVVWSDLADNAKLENPNAYGLNK